MKALNGMQKLVMIVSTTGLMACAPMHFVSTASPVSLQSVSPVTPAASFYPSQGTVAAVVFEDSYPKAGDGDYNDFLTDFHVIEKINSQNQITEIVVDFYPRAVGASYDHQFLMVLNGVKDQPSNLTLQTSPLFNGAANVTLSHYDANGNLLDSQANLPTNHDVQIFNSTHAIFGLPVGSMTIVNTYANQAYIPAKENARLDIVLNDPSSNPVSAAGIDLSKLRMVLHVVNTNEDIDIINVNPAAYDVNGNPFGFVIPSNWQWPTEGTNITTVYPNFSQYKADLIQLATLPNLVIPADVANWFMSPLVGAAGLYPAIPAPQLLPDP